MSHSSAAVIKTGCGVQFALTAEDFAFRGEG